MKKIREGSIAWYACRYVKPVTLILALSAIIGVFILVSDTNDAQAQELPPKLYIKSGYYDGNNIIVTDNKNIWKYETDFEMYDEEPVLVTFSDNGTESIYDDDITEIKPKKQKWDIPLSTELQEHVITLCREYNIKPELVFAIIQRESNYNANAIGDNGTSFGLMQVRQMCHKQRMKKIDCTNLLNPFENIAVGIDILAEKLNKYSTIEEAITAYNAGDTGAYEYYFSKGIYANEYALEVINIMQSLEGKQ